MRGTMMGVAMGLACAALGGCSGYHLMEARTPPLDLSAAPPADVARVCVLRPGGEAGFVTFAVRDNDQLVGATRGGGYFCYHAEPGDHHITSQADNDRGETWLSIAAGRSYYVEQVVDSSFQQIALSMRVLDEAQGRQAMAGRAYQMLVRAPGDGPALKPVPLARAQAQGRRSG